MIMLRSILLLVCGVIAFVWVDAAPFYSLPGPYYFNEQLNTAVQLTNLVCVKGNNARSIQFQMQTNTVPPGAGGFGLMIGMLL